jgi:hypothetical protein
MTLFPYPAIEKKIHCHDYHGALGCANSNIAVFDNCQVSPLEVREHKCFFDNSNI